MSAMVLTFVFGYLVSGRAGGIHPGAHVATLWALAVEVVCTMALVAVVLNVAATRATQGNAFYGLAGVFTIVGAASAGGPVSGGTVNPAAWVRAGSRGVGWRKVARLVAVPTDCAEARRGWQRSLRFEWA